MKVKQTGITLAAVSLLVFLFLAGCGSTGQTQRNPVLQNDPGEGYASLFAEGGRGSLTINNQAGFDVIVFAGKVANNNVLGGIRAGKSRTFDLSALPLPDSGGFLVRAVAYENFLRKGLSHITGEDIIYTGFAAYNKNDTTPFAVEIPKIIDESQTTCIAVSNSSNFVLQLHLDSPDGKIVAALAPLAQFKRIWITPHADGSSHTFFPSYVYMDPETGEPIRFFDTYARGIRIIPASGEAPLSVREFHGPDPNAPLYNVAFVELQNNTDRTVGFVNNGSYLRTTRGTSITPAGRSEIYEIDPDSSETTHTGLSLDFDT
ncbi:MAG: hypothetical protein LBP23_02605, partial [Treponema sp.]|nr:hypothetical protein [Treponema sp.]